MKPTENTAESPFREGVFVTGGKLIATGVGGILSPIIGYSTFSITGGTVVARGSAADIVGFRDIVIYGGSVNARVIGGVPPINGSGNTIYLVAVTVGDPPVRNMEVTCSVNGGTPFPCITDEDGKLYPWMPEGNGAAEIDVDGAIYRASGTVETNYDNVMRASHDSVVTGVVVSPASVTAAGGTTVQFSAIVEGLYHPPQTVTWTVQNGHAGTVIDGSGLLKISSGETSTNLLVTATSTYDARQSGTAETAVISIPTVVIGVVLILLVILIFVVVAVLIPYFRR